MSNTLDLLALLKLVSRDAVSAGNRPNPTALPSLVYAEDVEDHRSLSCSAYDDCLDVAFRRRWRSWTCRRCGMFPLASQFRASSAVHDAALRPLA